jgi:preprotein translocase subunit SecE
MNPVAYFKDTIAELKLVTWPTKKQTINLTVLVVGISVFVGVYIGSLDFLFTNLLKLIAVK